MEQQQNNKIVTNFWNNPTKNVAPRESDLVTASLSISTAKDDGDSKIDLSLSSFNFDRQEQVSLLDAGGGTTTQKRIAAPYKILET